jgi:hypothetical protein
VAAQESWDDQWLADLCTDWSSIRIVYVFYLNWNPVNVIQQWDISHGAPIRFPIRQFALSLKHFHGPLNSAGK